MQLKYNVGDIVWFVTPVNGNVYNKQIRHIDIDLFRQSIRVQARFEHQGNLLAYIPLEKCFSTEEEAVQNYLKNKYPKLIKNNAVVI